MDFDAVSTIIGFVTGVPIGAAGMYLGDKYTDRRRAKETEREGVARFERTVAKVPELISKMREALEETPVVREFGVCGGHALYFLSPNPGKRHDHDKLACKVQILENEGYVERVFGDTDYPKYRMTEEFVDHITRSKR